jgi:hypothetical protein
MMALRIRDYFKSLGLDEDKARELHQKYYREYGLAIRGLVKHHDIGASRARPQAGPWRSQWRGKVQRNAHQPF